jgi:hypothetical protein
LIPDDIVSYHYFYSVIVIYSEDLSNGAGCIKAS